MSDPAVPAPSSASSSIIPPAADGAVLVLWTAPPHALDADTARAAATAAAADPDAIDWLAPGRACELPLPPRASADDVLARVRAALAGRPIDAAVVPRAGRRKRLLIADMESTIIGNEMLDELADLIGVGPRVAAITARAMNGELDFRAALAERVGLLADQPAARLEDAWARLRVTSGAATLVATLRAHGAVTALVSGGFTWFSARVASQLGFDHHQANVLEIVDGRLTGRVVEPILDRDAKRAALERLCADAGCTPADAIAVGDGANDLAMLGAAGLGVAFRAKPRVAAAARVRVDHGDLRALLYLQGYREADFVDA